MSRPIVPAIAAAFFVMCASQASAYFAPSAAFTETSWTFPISPGGFIGGMDAAKDSDGAPVVAFSESGTLYTMRAGATAVLHEAPSPVFSSFVLADTTHQSYVFAESSSGTVSEIGFDGSCPRTIGAVSLPYDAAVDASGRLFITSAASYSGPSQIVCLDRDTGQAVTVATVEGPTGPLAIDGEGSIYYGTCASVFGQTGGQTIYKLSPGQVDAVLSGAPPLTAVDLTAVANDIDSPSDLLALPDGRLLFSSSVRSPGRIVQIRGPEMSVFAELESSNLFLTNLAWLDGSVFVNVGGVYGQDWSPYGVIVQLVPEPATLTSLAFVGAGSLLALGRRRTRQTGGWCGAQETRGVMWKVRSRQP